MHMYRRDSILLGLFLFALGMQGTPLYACELECVFVRPTGAITSTDPISLELFLSTNCSGRPLAQPTQLSIVGNTIAIDVYPAAVGICFPGGGGMTDLVELGSLPPGEYTYQVTQHANANVDCLERVVSGTFCVQDTLCIGPWCACNPRISRYSVRELNPEHIDNEYAQGVNDVGHLVGRAYGPGGQVAFLDVNEVRTYLGTLSPWDSSSSALGVNNLDEVVGYSFDSGSQIARAVLWKEGMSIDLGTLGKSSQALAINDAGEIVGWSRNNDGGLFPVYWPSGSAGSLSTLEGVAGRATDINESGVIVGSTVIDGFLHAALWRDGTLTDLGTLGRTATALGINELDQVVGRSQRDDGAWPSHAFLWENGEMTDLGVLWGFERSEAVAINDDGQILGAAFVEGVDKAFLYDPVLGLQWLQYVMQPADQCYDIIPYDLGDGGHIVGHREVFPLDHWGAALLSPLVAPENTPPIPAASLWGLVSLVLLLLSAGTVVLHRRVLAVSA
jgi:probable HAF family extracellular repeat protein